MKKGGEPIEEKIERLRTEQENRLLEGYEDSKGKHQDRR